MWLKVEPDLADRYKVSWGIDGPDAVTSYHIGTVSIGDAAVAVRAQLDALSNCAHANPDAYSSNAPEQRAHFRSILRNLAQAGRALRQALFNDPAKAAEIRELQELRTDQYGSGDNVLEIHPDRYLDVPWGLIYDGNVPALAEHADVEQEMRDLSGFWCLKYRLSAIVGHHVRAKSKWTRPRETFGMLSLINHDVKFRLSEDLPKDLYDEFCEYLNPPVGEPSDLDHCLSLVESTKSVDVLVHFLGHHDKQKLVLGDKYQLSYQDFADLLETLTNREELRNARPCGLLFLNGCDSAVGEKDRSLRNQASRPELCGAIATESKVRRKYAALFGVHFLRRLIRQGKTLSTAMHELHHDSALWPENLLYGCYAHPDFCIGKAT